MNKRVLAWIVLIGFVLLIINITFIGFYRVQSFIAYVIIAVFYLFYGKKINKG